MIAIIIAIGAGYFVVRGLDRLEFNRTHEQLASLCANTISNFYLSSDIDTAQRLIDKLAHAEVSDIKIISGYDFVAHSKKELIGQRIPKALYDQTKEIGRTNKAVVSWPATETINVKVPQVKAGEYLGLVDLNYKTPKFVPQGLGFLFLGILALALALYLSVVWLLKRYLKLIAFGFIAGLILLLYSLTVQSLAVSYANFNQAKNEMLYKIESALQAEPELMGPSAAFISSQKIGLAKISETNRSDDLRFVKNAFIFIGLLSIAVFAFIAFGIAGRIGKALFKNRLAYYYVAPATVGMLILVFFPIFFGLVLGFTDYSLLKFKEPIWDLFIGFKNFIDILSDFKIFSYENFYYTLFITVIWTAGNVSLHVGIGLLLALILNSPVVAGRNIYRTLLILPWAVPNYITALIWKGMFQRQFGAVNGLLNLFGLSSISWFDKPVTSFLTNLITNVWLGFPFMMVIALGALQSIPAEFYEAAEVDGASGWQRFRNITLPLLRPAMTPAIILGVVWTFNMFNIIYLVSGGAPYGATDILITSAYRWAFEKYQYGYAAAYSTIIFIILLGYSVLNIRISRATESAYEKR